MESLSPLSTRDPSFICAQTGFIAVIAWMMANSAAASQKQTASGSIGSTRIRLRAPKACNHCNARRVKCDASLLGVPCSRCQSGGIRDCALIKSRRGTYQRKKAALETSEYTAAKQAAGASHICGTAARAPTTIYEVGDNGPRRTRQTTTTDLIPKSRSGTDATAIAVPVGNSTQLLAHGDQHGTIPPHRQQLDSTARTPDSVASDTTARSSSRDISWIATFDRVLEGRYQGNADVLDKCSITYLGETFPLAMFLNEFGDESRSKVHHPGPTNSASTLRLRSEDPTIAASMPKEDLDFLKSKGAFSRPEQATLIVLVGAFMDRVYPLYPILDPQEIWEQCKTNELPLILMHSICYAALTFCPDALVSQAGFSNRKAARIQFQTRAKALFDVGWESDQMIMLQSALLLSFWGGGPRQFWNFYSWISIAVTIAETLGMHRSIAHTNMETKDKSLFKRLWWTLVNRDTACSAFIGRPFRIDLTQCDTEQLFSEDFPSYSASGHEHHGLKDLYGQYHIHNSRLVMILRTIVAARFRPAVRHSSPDLLSDQLEAWRGALPPQLSWGQSTNALALALSICHNHMIILSYMGESTRTEPALSGSLPSTAIVAAETCHNSAQAIVNLASMALRKTELLALPHEAFHGLFMAEAVCFTRTRSPNQLISQLGHASLNTCQMLFHVIQDAFDASPWVIPLFDTLLSCARNEPRKEQGSHRPCRAIDAYLDSMPSDDLSSPLPTEKELWHNYPILSAIFDVPPQTDSGAIQDSVDLSIFDNIFGSLENHDRNTGGR